MYGMLPKNKKGLKYSYIYIFRLLLYQMVGWSKSAIPLTLYVLYNTGRNFLRKKERKSAFL